MKHNIDTMVTIRDLVADYSKTIDELRIQNKQLKEEIEFLRNEILDLKSKKTKSKKYGR